ncbi:hypothetical protein NMY22_g10011 [Coprinellus aureogranulatus]|nr:hypothetical protein NMY22_g10011 [Coprinellus aureogranulatus]
MRRFKLKKWDYALLKMLEEETHVILAVMPNVKAKELAQASQGEGKKANATIRATKGTKSLVLLSPNKLDLHKIMEVASIGGRRRWSWRLVMGLVLLAGLLSAFVLWLTVPPIYFEIVYVFISALMGRRSIIMQTVPSNYRPGYKACVAVDDEFVDWAFNYIEMVRLKLARFAGIDTQSIHLTGR